MGQLWPLLPLPSHSWALVKTVIVHSYLLPGHIARFHFPASLGFRWGHMTKVVPVDSVQKWGIPILSQGLKTGACFFHALIPFPGSWIMCLPSRFDHTHSRGWRRNKIQEMWIPEWLYGAEPHWCALSALAETWEWSIPLYFWRHWIISESFYYGNVAL